CGLATYIGLKLGAPSIGVTKKKLYGRVEEPENVMKAEPIYDDDEVIGYAIKTCKKCKPIYVSPGHLISPETAVMLVKMCVKKHKLPEPIRLAHELASESKFKLNH
ncbi:MAG: endonuclease V, partial [Archaeoglobales archaeon]